MHCSASQSELLDVLFDHNDAQLSPKCRCVNEQEALLLPQQAIVDRTERSLDIARAAASAAALDLRQGATDRDEKRATVEAVAQAQSQRAVAVQTKCALCLEHCAP